MSVELKTTSGGSVTLVPEDGVSNVTATVKHESGVLASEQFALSNDLGVGQTWQNVTASRSVGVTYTNNTGKPIHVKANGTVTAAGNMWGWFVDGELATYASASGSAESRNYAEVIVPNGATYKCEATAIFSWFELR